MDRDAHNFRHQLQPQHWDQLALLELILQQPHVVQTAMAVENTPMLAATIPAFELFVSSWNAMQDDPDLANANIVAFIKPGLELANKYYSKMGDTDTYVISMSPIAVNMIVQTLDWYRTTSTSLEFSAAAGRASSGQWTVEQEMDDYVSSSIPPRSSTDMIGYWTNHGSKTWKTIYRRFLDYAPIQATSVPSEQVFSSSAETDTKRRNRTSPLLMETLQMLKFNFKKTRLNFMSE
ncbi:hypothetical protein C8R44DRAFT_924460, partial [Mycena epipterygia]